MKISTQKQRTHYSGIIGILLLLLLAFCVDCKKTEPVNLGKVQALAQLATVEYTLTKIVYYVHESFWGDKRILFQVYATVKAGIDLNDIKENDIKIEKKTITIQLPRPKILSLQIRPEDIFEKYNSTGVLIGHFTIDEKQKILTDGEKSIKSILENDTDLLKSAGENAKLFLESCFKMMKANKQIIIKFREK